MKWTKKQPTEPGYYWLRGYYEEPFIVEIEKGYETLLVCYFSDEVPDDLNPYIKCKWYGPLKVPE